jgi:hypothetical protein
MYGWMDAGWLGGENDGSCWLVTREEGGGLIDTSPHRSSCKTTYHIPMIFYWSELAYMKLAVWTAETLDLWRGREIFGFGSTRKIAG